MKWSTVLKRAARLVDEGNCFGCCAAIACATKTTADGKLIESLYDEVIEIFASLFDDGSVYWFGQRNHRVIALLMTAAMAESVGM